MERRALLNLFVKVGILSLVAAKVPAQPVIRKTPTHGNKRAHFSPETDQLGRFYLSACPEDTPYCRKLMLELGYSPANPLKVDHGLGRVFSKQIRNDFRVGNTFILCGWVLSRTELRLATLNIL